MHPRQIAAAAEALAAAEKPVLYVGGGTINADACAELRELAEAGGIPVVTTLMAKGAFPDSHPLAYGAPGMHGSKWANWAMNKCDLLVAVGVALRRPRHREALRLRGGREGHPPRHRLGGDRQAPPPRHPRRRPAQGRPRRARDPGAEAPHIQWQGARGWRRQIDAWREEFPYRYAKSDDLKPQTVLESLRDLTAGRDDVIWTTGVGQHQMWAMQYLVCDRPRSFITSGGLGTMGYGVPAAVGAKAACPDATVVCVDGDGCFQMTCQELATSVLEGLPIVTVIVNNGWLGMVRQWQEMFYDERFAQTHLTHQVPDYAQLAEAYGAAGFTVSSEDELEPALEEALTCGRAAVVDARVDPEEKCFPMIPAGAAASDCIEFDAEEWVEA